MFLRILIFLSVSTEKGEILVVLKLLTLEVEQLEKAKAESNLKGSRVEEGGQLLHPQLVCCSQNGINMKQVLLGNSIVAV